MEGDGIRRVGVVGLGRMGLAIGQRLAGAGIATGGYDRAEAARQRAADAGLAVAADPAALTAESDLVIVAVGFESEVASVLDSLAKTAPAELIVAVVATVRPGFMRSLAGRGGKATLLDAPLARGEAAAKRGDLLMFVGGASAALDRARPAFATFASEIHHLGPLGAGQAAKACNNFLLWTNVVATTEAYDLAEAQGVDRDALRAALANASGANWAMATRAEERPALWAEKDMEAVLAEADTARLPLPLAAGVKEAMKAFKRARGLPAPEEG